jgi:hypothetical protein
LRRHRQGGGPGMCCPIDYKIIIEDKKDICKILWRIRAIEYTPSPARDDMADGRCRCCGGGPVGAPLLLFSAVTWHCFPLWHNTRHRCWLRQQATGNGIKNRRVSLWIVSMWSGATQCESKSYRREWATRSESGTWGIRIVWLVATVWIVKSPSPVKSSSYELSCIEWMAGLQ